MGEPRVVLRSRASARIAGIVPDGPARHKLTIGIRDDLAFSIKHHEYRVPELVFCNSLPDSFFQAVRTGGVCVSALTVVRKESAISKQGSVRHTSGVTLEYKVGSRGQGQQCTGQYGGVPQRESTRTELNIAPLPPPAHCRLIHFIICWRAHIPLHDACLRGASSNRHRFSGVHGSRRPRLSWKMGRTLHPKRAQQSPHAPPPVPHSAPGTPARRTLSRSAKSLDRLATHSARPCPRPDRRLLISPATVPGSPQQRT